MYNLMMERSRSEMPAWTEAKSISSCFLCGSFSKVPCTPIGIFWDIENVRLPNCYHGMAVVEAIRQRFLVNYREAEFLVVCDVNKEKKELITNLNNAQVTVVHVSSTHKNACDEKLRQTMRRFADNIGTPCAIMLITSDVNFTTDLCDFKNRKNIHIILLHQILVSEALLLCSNEHYLFDDILEDVPFLVDANKENTDAVYLNVLNLPHFVPPSQIRQRVQQIAGNCGGKMVQLAGGRGIVRFNGTVAAQRALLRMEGEDVFGRKISVQFPPLQPSAGSRMQPNDLLVVHHHSKEMIEGACKRHFTPFPPPPNPAKVAPPRLLNLRPRCDNGEEKETVPSYEELCTELADQPSVDDTFHRAVLDADGPNRWDYYRTPSEYLVEKTPQGHRRIRGNHKAQHQSPFKSQENHAHDKDENRAAYIPFPAPATENLKPVFASTPSQPSLSPVQPPAYTSNTVSAIAVDLHVTNLDQSIGAKEMKTLISSVFKQHVMVMNVTVHLQNDGHLAAIVRVPSIQDAQYCVSQLHRRKLGSKRIMIAYDQNSHGLGSGRSVPTPLQIRAQVNALLAEIPQRRLPLFKFRELYEQRYTTSVSLADLHRLRDILHVTDDVHGRCVVFLQNQYQPSKVHQFSGEQFTRDVISVSRSSSSISEPELSVAEMPRCPLHDCIPNNVSHGWAEPEPSPELPLVYSTLHQIALHTHCLLQSHGGTIPLASLARCFEIEMGGLNVNEEKGVPLEHLISCVKGVGIVSVAGHKRLQWSGKNDQLQDNEPLQSLNPSLLPQMSLLCRELVDLLKMAPQSRIPFSKFIPAYHHHFGRQCRVADYGYTRLIDLLESLSHVVQILGEGTRRHVTLSHKAQMKRFTSDLLRNLKAQASKQMSVSIFATLYEKTLGRPFDPRDYGLCHLSDLLSQVAEASVVVMTTAEGEEIIALPKREQTLEEMERTKQFAVVELLKHAPQCKLDFAKFIPAYHHHFGRQCRVSDYGCQKLVELFETIPETVQVFEMDNEIEKYVQLTMKQRLKILSEQVTSLVRNHSAHQPLLLNYLPEAFRIHYGFALRPEQYNAVSLDELVGKLRNHVQVVYSERGAELSLIDQNSLSNSKFRVVTILYPVIDGSMPLHKLLEKYKEMNGHECPHSFLTDYMEDIVIVDSESKTEPIVRFVPIMLFSRQVHLLLNENGGRLLFANFESSYLERFGVQCRPSTYGQSSIMSLLQSIRHLVVIRGKGPRRVLTLHREMAGLIPPSVAQAPKPSWIKPPAHWLISPEEKIISRQEDKSPDKEGIYEDLKQFFNSAPASSVMFAPVPTFIPSVSWSPIWGMAMGIPLSVSPTYVSNTSFSPNWNASGTTSNYPCNYWFTAWHTPCTFPVPVTPVPSFTLTGASVEEIEETTSGPGIPPPASVLPRPSLIMASHVDKTPKSPVKSRIAAQFRTPAIKPLN
ncbi:meiosis regulator and mRNA stability factor 1-like isoform X2 [Daphnia pulicaria]|uniref:meiosis regulator and mRNA stability factor 1-like isoform X2 n=1 Tax=Daphnia pulicaria TaxID=35523 RepID=UPI001EEA5FA5|nr:meiosis regulator and mRNA stability factor 1-like isoform X2 [Daphnia pulicaria]